MTPRAALLLRVSTREQTVANQLPHMRRIADARGFELVTVRVEVESRDKRRPVLEDLLREAHRGTFDVLIVWALDRLGAGTLAILGTIKKLDERGVTTVSVSETWLEMKGPVRDLLLTIFGWISEQELRRIRERTRAGLERARAEGKRLGRPSKGLAPWVIAAELAKGGGLDRVAARLGVGRATLCRQLARFRKLGRLPSSLKNGTSKTGT